MSGSLYMHGGPIWTGPECGDAQSVTIVDGQVRAINAPCPAGVRGIDLLGRCAMPGLVDSHLHLVMGASGLGDVDLAGATSRAHFEELLAEADAALPDGAWLTAAGWSEQALGEAPDGTWLAAGGARPVLCHRVDLHAAVVNDVVLEMINLDAVSSDPAGRLGRDASGSATGLLVEGALWNHVLPLVPSVSVEERRSRTLAEAARMHRCGITMVGSMEYELDLREVLAPLQEDLGLRMRVMMLGEGSVEELDRWSCWPATPWLAVTGAKGFIDGTLGSRTARMYEPWHDRPEDRGILVEKAAAGELAAWAKRVAECRLAPCMHAIGDEAVGIALEILGATDPALAGRIEHAQIIAARDAAALDGIWLAVQPLHRRDDALDSADALGDRAGTLHAYRMMLDAGARLAFGSDWPIAPHDPLAAMAAAIIADDARGDPFHPDQALTPLEALEASTAAAADALRSPDAGRLQEGCLGDVVVLDEDPRTCHWHERVPQVMMTIVDGAIVYERSDGQ